MNGKCFFTKAWMQQTPRIRKGLAALSIARQRWALGSLWTLIFAVTEGT